MSTLEICAPPVGMSSVVIAVTSVIGLASLRRIRQRLETRVHHTVDILVDEIEPPLRWFPRSSRAPARGSPRG